MAGAITASFQRLGVRISFHVGLFLWGDDMRRVPRVGFLSASGDSNTPGPQVEAFKQGMRDLGYIDGQNILVEYHYIEGKLDRAPNLVAELVQPKPDVILLLLYQRSAQLNRRRKQFPLSS
jgi:putative tryptophan/tyrosine transport system substrate-binding protein